MKIPSFCSCESDFITNNKNYLPRDSSSGPWLRKGTIGKFKFLEIPQNKGQRKQKKMPLGPRGKKKEKKYKNFSRVEPPALNKRKLHSKSKIYTILFTIK